jgi:Uma2 family endonuclease
MYSPSGNAITSRRKCLPKTKYLYTEREYLDFERTSEERHEYQDGEIYAMAGEKLAHGQISVKLVLSLASQLKGSPCQVLTKDMKVRSGPVFRLGESRKGRYSYPDILVVCGDPEYLDEAEEVILNPKVIVEVLSKSTENIDRGDKSERYQKSGMNPSGTTFSFRKLNRSSNTTRAAETAAGHSNDILASVPPCPFDQSNAL